MIKNENRFEKNPHKRKFVLPYIFHCICCDEHKENSNTHGSTYRFNQHGWGVLGISFNTGEYYIIASEWHA